MLRWFRPFIVFVGLLPILLHIGCASMTASEALPAEPTVWSAKLPDAGKLFLVGSVQLLEDPTDFGSAVDWAFSDASELVVQLDPSQLGSGDVEAAAKRYGRAEMGVALHRRLDPATMELLGFYLARRGFSPEPIEQLQPWVVATAISAAEYRAIGLTPGYGVDRALLARADGSKQVAGLESLDAHFAELSGLPDEVQSLMLRDVLEQTGSFRSQVTQLDRAWRRGDDAALERLLFPRADRPEYAAYYESYVFEPNRRLADRLAALADDGRTRLVVIGAAHMLGDRGIPALLEKQGFEVERVVPQ